jgi:hypothetical protein
MEYEVNKKRGPVLWSEIDGMWVELVYYVEETNQYVAIEMCSDGERAVKDGFVIIEGEDIFDFKPLPCGECGIPSSIEQSVSFAFNEVSEDGNDISGGKLLCNDCKKKLGYKRMNEFD